MTEHMTKPELLDKIRTGYAELDQVLAPLNEAQMTTGGENGAWSIKDILAHLAAWQQRTLTRIEAALRNEKPAIPPLTSDEEIDQLNEHFYQENKHRSLSEVLSNFRTSSSQLLEAVQAAPEEVLIDPQRVPWLNGIAVWQIVAGNTYEHIAEHMDSIQKLTQASKE